jgi:acyl dehydratase
MAQQLVRRGVVSVRTRGINQNREVVLEFKRSFMVYKRDAEEVIGTFPISDATWSV